MARCYATANGQKQGVLARKGNERTVVLRTVAAALRADQAPAPAAADQEFNREHMQLMTDKLSQMADDVRRANERLSALVDLSLDLGSKRDPLEVLQAFCHSARQ